MIPIPPDPSEAEFVGRVREPRSVSGEPGRHRARRSAMMLLYRSDLTGVSVEDLIESFPSDNGFEITKYTAALVRAVADDSFELDRAIDGYLDGWTVDRLGAVERSVLRIAMWELAHQHDVPGPVAIDEAVELAKRYATPDAAKLVNGVLAAWYRDNIEAQEQ